ncbi:MAG: hypothetical protein KJ941_08215 [Bacteroidetes bacterium]|nr:hypothetical protein [Bacteroidota bacterium]
MTQGSNQYLEISPQLYSRYFLVMCFVTSIFFYGRSQVYLNNGFGLKLNVVANFGTLKQSVGIQFSSYYQYACIQLNQNYQVSFSTNNLGTRRNLIENRMAFGLNFFTNKNLKTNTDLIWNEIRQQGNGSYSLGYSYLLYLDNRKTNQKSGAFGVGLKDFFISFENDLFAGQGRDRFRTAQLEVSYQAQERVYSTGFQLWTGETRGSDWIQERSDKHPYGYRLLEDLPYGTTSHGVLYFGFGQFLTDGNRTDLKIGYEDERIRGFFQNYLSHDLPFLPKNIERNTPHYPLLDSLGCPIITEGKPKKGRIVGSMGVNGNWSY